MQPTEHENLNTLASSAHRQIAGRHCRAIPRSTPTGVRRRVLAALIWLAVAGRGFWTAAWDRLAVDFAPMRRPQEPDFVADGATR